MKYQAPYGMTDQNSPYINGDPTIGRLGSIPPASAFEYPMREIDAIIRKNFIVPADDDLTQVMKAIRSQRSNFADDTGAVNSLVVAYDPPLAAYTLGLILRVRAKYNCTGPTTINAGAGIANVIRADGNSTAADDIVAGGIAELVYDGNFFQLVNYMGKGGAAGGGDTINNYLTQLPYALDDSPTPGIVHANFGPPALQPIVPGTTVLVKLNNTLPGGAATFAPDAQAAKPMLANGGPTVLQGDSIAGDIMLLRFDGTSWYFDPYPLITSSCTLNVPSQYSTPTAAITALKRKAIAPGATVTIKLAAGIYPSFTCDHPNGDRIIIQGTMIGSTPTWTSFSMNGPSAAARAQDSAINIGILRSRYGTEIQTATASGSCFQNLGAGPVTLVDCLCTGPNYGGSNTSGVYATGNQSILCFNVASWGHSWGFTSIAGALTCHACFSLGNFGAGYYCDSAGRIGIQAQSSGNSNGFAGIYSDNHAVVLANYGFFMSNGSYGFACGDHSHGNMINNNTSMNGGVDNVAYNLSEIYIQSAQNAGTMSPASNTMGNNGSLITLS